MVDIPNQVEAKNVYLKGWCYSRQIFAREYEPFEWKPLDKLRKKYEEPLKILSKDASLATQRQRIVLEYARDEEVDNIVDN